MKAVRLHKIGDLRCDEVPVPVPVGEELLIRVGGCGICGSDIPRVFSHGSSNGRYPLTIGHEFAGEVVQAGEAADPGLVGTRGAIFPLIPCRECEPCLTGKYAMCEHYDYLGSRRDGGFAEYCLIPSAWHLISSQNASMEALAMTEPACVAQHAVRRANVVAGQFVVIFGAGAIGILAARWAQIFGAEALLVDIAPDKVAFAREKGLRAVNSREVDLMEEIKGQNKGQLVDAENGQVLASYSVQYPHGNTEEGLAYAEDYEQALLWLLDAVTPENYRNSVEGICVDATSLTLVCLARDGQVLSRLSGLSDRPHAQVKLWKYHGARQQAEEAFLLAKERQEPFLKRTGGTISSEWMLPKLLEIRDEDSFCYEEMDCALNLCEFLTFCLTGRLARSMGSMCYKGLWARDLGFPSEDFLNGLRPGFAEEYRYRMRGAVLRPGEAAGVLKPELCRQFGLKERVTVAAGILDGHTALAALGALEEGDAALVAGTSNVLTVQTDRLCEVEGICDIAQDGQVPGLYGIDSGQNSAGDMLE